MRRDVILAIRRNGASTHATIQMNLENLVLNKTRPLQKAPRRPPESIGLLRPEKAHVQRQKQMSGCLALGVGVAAGSGVTDSRIGSD